MLEDKHIKNMILSEFKTTDNYLSGLISYVLKDVSYDKLVKLEDFENKHKITLSQFDFGYNKLKVLYQRYAACASKSDNDDMKNLIRLDASKTSLGSKREFIKAFMDVLHAHGIATVVNEGEYLSNDSSDTVKN